MTDHDEQARCAGPRCNTPLSAGQEPGELCTHCALIRSLEDERLHHHQRRT